METVAFDFDLDSMCFTAFFVKTACRNKKVERCLECELRLVRQRLKAIPSCGPQSARRIRQAIEGERKCLIGGIHISKSIHAVCLRIVEFVITTDSRTESVNIEEVALHTQDAPLF